MRPLLLIATSPSPLRGWRHPHCIVVGGGHAYLSISVGRQFD
jgi:hypothetical protein